jgi:hypothetical protein
MVGRTTGSRCVAVAVVVVVCVACVWDGVVEKAEKDIDVGDDIACSW